MPGGEDAVSREARTGGTGPEAYPLPAASRRLKDLPAGRRPRESFDRMGAEAVPDEMLLALVLGGGVSGRNVLDVARALLSERYGSLAELARASVDELLQVRGIGPVRARTLSAAMELARRLADERLAERPAIRSPGDAAEALRARARGLGREVFWMLPLNRRNQLLRMPTEVSRGLADASLVHPREVFMAAIRCGAVGVVLAHNHPSGDPTPSAEDIGITRQIVQAGEILGIEVLDHVILGQAREAGGSDYTSLREAGLVAFGKGSA